MPGEVPPAAARTANKSVDSRPVDDEPLLRIRGLTKRFPGVVALDSVDCTVRAGEVHALLGENGAGKSTLIKVLTGVYPRDAGEIRLAGEPLRLRSPLQAQQVGIRTVYQEVNLIPHMSVAENLGLGRQPRRLGCVRHGALRRQARLALQALDLHIDVTAPLGSFSVAIQQMVAIARALGGAARVLILDEPTSSLDDAEVQRLFGVLRRLKSQGMAIIFITHFIEQVYTVCDRITVLRNGRLVGEYEAAKLPRLELIAKMIGRSLADGCGAEQGTGPLPDGRGSVGCTDPAATAGDESEHRGSLKDAERAGPVLSTRSGPVLSTRSGPVLTARGLGRTGAVHPLDLTIHRGEVVGLAGLLGSGRTETARLLFGLDRADSGSIAIRGLAAKLTSPRRAIAARIGFCPEDRKAQGIVPELSVRENILLAIQARRGWLRRVPPRTQREIAERFIRALRIATPDAEKPAGLLSGGNQQKVILARWLASQPELLILDEPTRGIDVGAKAEVESLVRKLRSDGMAILFISSEIEEVARDSQRVIVLRDRRKVGELVGSEISVPAIMRMIAAVGKA